jgi:LPS sulfotransferase NodH
MATTERRQVSVRPTLSKMSRSALGVMDDRTADQVKHALYDVQAKAHLLKCYFDGLKPMGGIKCFVLLGLTGSGTTFFGDLLGQDPDVTWLDESFNPQARYPVLYLRGLARGHSTSWFGLKVFSFQLSGKFQTSGKDHDQPDIDRARRILEKLGGQGWKFIHLKRSNIFAQCVSHCVAEQKQVWHRTFHPRTICDEKMRLNLTEFERNLKNLLMSHRYEDELFAGTEMLRLDYEADLQDPAASQSSVELAFAYLGLSTTAVSGKYVKNGATPLHRQIEKYDEVARLAERLGVTPTE